MQIAFGADHGGLELKNDLKSYVESLGHTVVDCGTFTGDSCNYPDYAEPAARQVTDGACNLAILCCGTGIGMSMAANKIPGVRAAVCGDCFSAELTRRHNDANVLCLGARVVGVGLARKIVDTFLTAPFEGGRHQTRVDMIMALERRA